MQAESLFKDILWNIKCSWDSNRIYTSTSKRCEMIKCAQSCLPVHWRNVISDGRVLVHCLWFWPLWRFAMNSQCCRYIIIKIATDNAYPTCVHYVRIVFCALLKLYQEYCVFCFFQCGLKSHGREFLL